MQIEICANSFDSARAAQQGGADRIELCTELAVGGLTPSHGLIEKVVSELQIPVHVLIRPRSGNFTYTASEIDVMLRDIVFCRTLGCAGIVSGALHPDTTIARQTLQALLAAAQDMSFTFHRAFDWCTQPFDALYELKQHPIDRVLTSGQQMTAERGLALLRQLKAQSGQKLEIMAGSCININNILLFKAEKFKSVHLSASIKRQVLTQTPRVPMHSNSLFEEGILTTSDASVISEIVSVCKG
ncbi:MAG TPA: copper homeostasis protein CutC [Leeuwenhoekiella sp.]|nr:copper homeostasis protein CutC [Leeuwenhoekiella sp.]